ncbi:MULTISPECIES: hypothetical protein [unclassified Polaromonas]|uniref:hypothetical protein n=1 Tax=unclassified Polaromonas TaxID=2638319 RepID=UPI0018CAA619|nr:MULTISPECIES: hypothetical protein [unclassified Polaromonas]MBG6072367.1 hypothetical protein [Polaromonas sp. CG_9.7]MBG6114202.1 hypothetical protein [Polaromonas sp. CG_9.2]MDH6182840.1 hypothetical protein [Polaromonas sp. CG_23.6]
MSRFLTFPHFSRFPGVVLALVSVLSLVAACSPALNWRDVRPEGTRLSLLLPCKPDKAQKVVPLGGRPTQLSMLGCDADGATFAVAIADVGDPLQAAPVLALWQDLTLANMKAAPASRQPLPLKIPGASPGTPVTRLQAQGQRADGTAVSGQAAYFAQGSQLFQVVIYAPRIAPEVAETFFSSLKFE